MISDHSEFAVAYKRMIKEQLLDRGIRNERVLDVMRKIPRELFVDEALKNQAYIDAPLQIGEGQTISQPYIVALMSESLQLQGHEKVLEIGTGCGYQTAILASLARQVYTIERFKSLGLKARERLIRLGLRNIVLRIGDGSYGWPEAAPFDAIIVTCAAPKIPDTYVQQLAVGGKLVIPVAVDKSETNQNLVLATKTPNGLTEKILTPCRFVKLVGTHGFEA